VTNEQEKTYTYKELAGILRTDYTVVNKKVKKHNLLTDQIMINGRLTKIIKISQEQIEAINQEIEFFRNKGNNQLGDNLPPNNQPFVSDSSPNEQPKTQIITREQADFSIKMLIEKLSESHTKEVTAKDETITILKEQIADQRTKIQELTDIINQLKNNKSWWKFSK